MSAAFVMNNLLRFEGMAKFSMVGIASGGILNMILDPIFIFGFGLGIAGAAIATALSQCISFGILLSCFLRKKTAVSLHPRHISKDVRTYLQIVNNGLASFFRQGLTSIANICLNLNAGIYGDSAIAAMSIVGKVMFVMFSVILGFGQGYQPVVGFNYGAKRFDRAKEAFLFMLKCCTGIGCVFAVVGFAIAPTLIQHMIGYDAEAVTIATFALRAQVLMFPFVPTNVACNMSYQSTGKSWTATFLSSARQGFFFLPAIWILPNLLGITGVQLAQPTADICTFLLAVPFAVRFYRLLSEKEREYEHAEA
jgi:Na+-driven multidrug efflux pump